MSELRWTDRYSPVDLYYELWVEVVGDEYVIDGSCESTDDVLDRLATPLDMLEDGEYVILIVSLGGYLDMEKAGAFAQDEEEA